MREIVFVDKLANVHSHQREGEVVGQLIQNAIAGGADVLCSMPNTNEGLKNADEVMMYNKMEKALIPPGKTMHFIPIVMITESTTEFEIYDCVIRSVVDGKVFPLMRTTKSHNGVKNYGGIIPIVKYCGEVGMKVHLHPEHPSMVYSNRDAEFAFLAIARMFLEETDAVIVWEHGTDARCIPHWKEMAISKRFFVTLTAHHLITNEDDTFGDVRAVCKPPIKTERDRLSLIQLVCENHSWVMAGGDDAFHDKSSKHVDYGKCACGAYTAPFLLPLYAQALEELFESDSGIETFVNFTSRNARTFHSLKNTPEIIKLERKEWQIPLTYPIGSQTSLPFWAGQRLRWQIVS